MGFTASPDVEAELHDVAVLHDVVLALHAGLALGARLGDRAGGDEVGERDDLGLDEAALEVGVDDARGLRGLPALVDRPRARLLRAGGEVRLQAERVEADAGELVEARLVLAGRREQLRGVVRVEVDELGLDLRVEEDGLGGRDERGELGLARGIRSTASSTLKT